METQGHEEVVFHHDRASGLRALIAIHSTVLGPAVGGTRWLPYETEQAALEDVIRLSSAMTAKAAVAGLDVGGGKAAVLGDPSAKTAEQLAAYGRFIERLGGRYVTTTDMGTTTADLDVLRDHTEYVVGTSPERGGSGDTSALTAVTVVNGMRAAMRFAFDDERFSGRHVVVVGVGKVGSRIARYAAEHGARITVADIRGSRAAELASEIGADVTVPSDAYAVDCDILSPNALGDVLTPETIPRLRCQVVCGAANNQLRDDPADALLLAERGIVYAPDYVVSAGGLINVAIELVGYDAARAKQLADRVYDTTLSVLRTAAEEGVTTAEAAARLVQARLASA